MPTSVVIIFGVNGELVDLILLRKNISTQVVLKINKICFFYSKYDQLL